MRARAEGKREGKRERGKEKRREEGEVQRFREEEDMKEDEGERNGGSGCKDDRWKRGKEGKINIRMGEWKEERKE